MFETEGALKMIACMRMSIPRKYHWLLKLTATIYVFKKKIITNQHIYCRSTFIIRSKSDACEAWCIHNIFILAQHTGPQMQCSTLIMNAHFFAFVKTIHNKKKQAIWFMEYSIMDKIQFSCATPRFQCDREKTNM